MTELAFNHPGRKSRALAGKRAGGRGRDVSPLNALQRGRIEGPKCPDKDTEKMRLESS